MATHDRNVAGQVAQDAKNTANRARETQVVDLLTRLGYAARGLIYGLIGYLAFRIILNGRGRITDQNGALQTIAAQPFGKVVLIIVAVGLVGLFIWGLIRAIADPYHKGNDTKGLVTRAGYLVSGISYGAMLVPALNLITGAGRSSGNSTQKAQQFAANIMTKPWGPFAVGLVGLILIGAGLYRMYEGYKGNLHERLKSYDMTSEERRIAVRMGRIGYVAFGLVMAIVGALALLAASTADPSKVGGLDAALQFLARQPYGPWILAVVALGLIAYAIYSFMGAIWFRIKEL